MFDTKTFGQRLSLLRKEKAVTQGEIAKLLDVTSTQISDMENGKTATTIARLYILCDYFNPSADYLLGRTDTPR